MWYVYILECQNGKLYTGVTNNLEERFSRHKSGTGGKFTHSFKAKKIVYSEQYCKREEVFRHELQIKGWTRKKKIVLINNDLQLLKKL